jgi:hypothetical protein
MKQSLLEEGIVCIVYNDSGNDAGINKELNEKNEKHSKCLLKHGV